MTQILVTLERGADSNLIRQIIDNIKGVFNTTIEKTPSKTISKDTDSEWMKQIKELSSSFNPQLIDLEDERTRYIMSK